MKAVLYALGALAGTVLLILCLCLSPEQDWWGRTIGIVAGFMTIGYFGTKCARSC